MKRKTQWIVFGVVFILCVASLSFLCYVWVSSYWGGYTGPYQPPYIEIEVYEQNDSANQVVWVVKNIRRSGEWGNVWGELCYSNGTVTFNHKGDSMTLYDANITLYGVNNSSLQLPNGKIKVGDLITVNAPWDGDAGLMLMYRPSGHIVEGQVAVTDGVHY